VNIKTSKENAETNEYKNQVLKPNKKKWKDKSRPTLATEKQIREMDVAELIVGEVPEEDEEEKFEHLLEAGEDVVGEDMAVEEMVDVDAFVVQPEGFQEAMYFPDAGDF
jgi:hypothetical protein